MPHEPSERPSRPVTTSPPPELKRRVAVVVNGRARNVTGEVISTLDQILEGSDLFVSRNLEDAREIAKTLVHRGYDTVLTGGGDGTFTVMVTEVVREARRRNSRLPRFGLLKLGTGNALAWVVGAREVDGHELGADIRRLCEEAGSRSVRFVEAEGIISPFCGFGADASVLGDYGWVKQHLGRTPLKGLSTGGAGYAIAAVTRSIPSLLFKKMAHCRVVNDGGEAYQIGPRGSIAGRPLARGEVLYEGPMRLCALSTIPYYGYGFRLFPFAEDRPDRMQLRVTTMTPPEFVANFRAIWRGEYENSKTVFDFLVDSVTIEMNPAAPFQVGGDSRGERESTRVVLSPTPIELVDFYAPPRGEAT